MSGSAPKLDPDDLSLRIPPRPVRRVSRRAVIGALGAGLTLILGAVIVALDPPRPFASDPAGRELYRTEGNPKPEGLENLPSRYSDLEAPIELGPPLPGDLGAAVLEAERDLSLPDSQAPFRADPEADARRAERIRLARLAQQGRESDIFFTLDAEPGDVVGYGAAPTLLGASSASAGPRDAMLLDPQKFAGELTAGAPIFAGAASDQNMQAAMRAFASAPVDDAVLSAHSLQEPVSPYQLMAGTIIPASLMTGLNSDLPGSVIAQVTENVYDTATGRHLLVPQGSRVIGTYDSQIAFGQDRALVVWRRIIRPDGSSVVIDNLPGTDPTGQAGLEDQVDFHTWRLLGGIALSSLLGVGTELASDQGEGEIVAALREAAQDGASRVGQELTERNLDIQPTITVRPGWPLRIIVLKDIILGPYGAGAASSGMY